MRGCSSVRAGGKAFAPRRPVLVLLLALLLALLPGIATTGAGLADERAPVLRGGLAEHGAAPDGVSIGDVTGAVARPTAPMPAPMPGVRGTREVRAARAAPIAPASSRTPASLRGAMPVGLVPARPVPHGERLPDAHGPLARSLVLGELHRADARTDTDAPGVADTVRAALVADDGLRASLARADAAAFEAGAARGAMLPSLALEAGMGSHSPMRAWGDAAYRTARAVLTVPVFASGANLATMRSARAAGDAAALAHLAEEHQAVLEAATAHLDLYAAIEVREALAANARGMVRTLAASRALFAAGEASLADAAVAEANLESARAELASGEQALERAREEYRARTGRAAPAAPRAPDTDGMVPADADEAARLAMAGPAVGVGFAHADAARHEARAELGRAGPRVELTGSMGHVTDAIDEPDGARDAALGVRLAMPLLDFTTVPGVRAARARARAAEYAARDVARDVERRVRIAHAAHAGAEAREVASRRREAAMERALDATRAEYAGGFRTVSDVVRAQVGLARARIDRANAARDRHRAAFTVAVMVGRVAPG